MDGIANGLIAKHSISSSEARNLNPMSWAQASHEIAVKYAYNNIDEGEKVSQDYIDQTQTLAENQVVLGGNRLANLMVSIFGDSVAPEAVEETVFLQ